MKLKDKWSDFVYIMLDDNQSNSCNDISLRLDISPQTAHRWRHKFLSSLNSISSLEIQEETELDEVYFPFTVKGVIGKEKFDVYISPNHPDNEESAFRKEEKKWNKKNTKVYLCAYITDIMILILYP